MPYLTISQMVETEQYSPLTKDLIDQTGFPWIIAWPWSTYFDLNVALSLLLLPGDNKKSDASHSPPPNISHNRVRRVYGNAEKFSELLVKSLSAETRNNSSASNLSCFIIHGQKITELHVLFRRARVPNYKIANSKEWMKDLDATFRVFLILLLHCVECI